jgi:hypothetical protein
MRGKANGNRSREESEGGEGKFYLRFSSRSSRDIFSGKFILQFPI